MADDKPPRRPVPGAIADNVVAKSIAPPDVPSRGRQTTPDPLPDRQRVQEWKEAESGWNAAKERAGAVPPAARDDLRSDIVKAMEQSEESSERNKPSSSTAASNPVEYLEEKAKSFSILGLLVFLAGNAVGDPLCIAGGDHFVKREWLETIIGFGFGIPLVALAWIFPFRASLFSPTFQASVRDHTYRWWPLAVLLAFIYAVGPGIYRRAGLPEIPSAMPTLIQQQEEEKIAARTATIQKQLNRVTQERDAANRRIQELEALQKVPSVPLTPAEGPRVYTDKTVEQIWDSYCEGRTGLQCSILMASEKNKWIKLGATIDILYPGGGAQLSEDQKKRGIICSNFDSQWLPTLTALKTGDHIKIDGQIEGFNVRVFILQHCGVINP